MSLNKVLYKLPQLRKVSSLAFVIRTIFDCIAVLSMSEVKHLSSTRVSLQEKQRYPCASCSSAYLSVSDTSNESTPTTSSYLRQMSCSSPAPWSGKLNKNARTNRLSFQLRRSISQPRISQLFLHANLAALILLLPCP